MKVFFCIFFAVFVQLVSSQDVSVYTDIKKHVFEGAGVSIGLYMGHHASMSAENQDKAVRFVNKDCNMLYLQDYIDIYPADNAEYFDKRANYIKAARVYSPTLKMSLVGNKFPTSLMRTISISGEELEVLDTTDPDIYSKVADWYFQLFEAFAERGVSVEILNVVNEPDLDELFRQYHYGQGANTFYAVAKLFEEVVPLFLAKFDDSELNTLNMPKPLIMGPSTISPYGCIEYITYFQEKFPKVWDMIDIVATHQYIRGAEQKLFLDLLDLIGDKPLYQSETHANKGDALGDLNLELSHQASLSLANLFCTAVNNGTSAWFYFESNYPHEYTTAALIRVAWNSSNPQPYKHYYVFKQLTSTQPAYAHVLSSDVLYDSNSDVIAFRKNDEAHIYVHYANYSSQSKSVKVNLLQLGTEEIIDKVSMWVCDETLDNELQTDKTAITGSHTLNMDVGAFSVNTLDIELSGVAELSTQRVGDGVEVFCEDKTLLLRSSYDEIESCKLYDMAGKCVLSIPDINALGFECDLSFCERGVYVVSLTGVKGFVTKKIRL